MNPAFNEVTTENLSIIVTKDGIVLSMTSYILRTYAYLFIGTMLTLINIPVFLLIIMRKGLRNSYLILAIVFLNNGLTGITAISSGAKRIIDSAHGERHIDHHDCVLNVSTLLLTTYFLNGFSLLMNSIERLCVVAFPIYYYTRSIRISYSLIIAQYTITVIAITSIVVASLIEPPRHISNFCLKFGAQYLSSHSNNRDLSHFLKKEKRYTHTALISCCFTFFLAVVPSIVQYIFILDPTARSRTIVIICVYLPFLNSFNMIMLFVYRQDDVRHAIVYSFKRLFGGQKD
uniref:7TM_GPCR_Srx domain-containing protein n=1 Tax=Onchocerca volvulus TaxID=6282 RepID=A0A8R1XRC8_ONCVO